MSTTLDRKPLGHFLLARGFVQQDQLDLALDAQRLSDHQKLLGEVLREKSFCTESQIIEALAESYDVPFAHISPRIADPRVIGLLPREFLEKHQVLPLFLVEGTLTIAVPEPANLFLIDEIERLTGHPAQVVAATIDEIAATLRAYLPEANVFVVDELSDEEGTPLTVVPPRVMAAPVADSPAAEEAVVRLVDHIIRRAIKEGACDIHVEPGDNSLRIRYRIDGRLIEKLHPPYAMHAAITARFKKMAALDPTEHRLPQEGDLRILLNQRPVNLRVSAMPGKWGQTLVIHILDHEKGATRLEKLGFGYDTLKQWRKLIAQPNGLLLVTGPTGSGKTLTLYASLAELNSNEVNICTLEDPVFGTLDGVNQFQVNEKAGFGFPSALQSVLRQDPDIVMVGEIPDPQTAKIATQAALTGHLVMSTLHTTDAPSSITRLFNLGVEPYLVGASLAGILSQRLVRKLCQACKEPFAPTITQRRHLEKFGGVTAETLFRPKGCPRCHNIGYHGRVGVYELLTMEDQLAERTSQGAGLIEIREIARKLGMKTLRVDGVEKVKAGITTLEEVYRVTA
jgi:type IV pilus assembly protein PilB